MWLVNSTFFSVAHCSPGIWTKVPSSGAVSVTASVTGPSASSEEAHDVRGLMSRRLDPLTVITTIATGPKFLQVVIVYYRQQIKYTNWSSIISNNNETTKIRTLLNYWIKHNKEHSLEFKEWAGKVSELGEADASEDMLLAAQAMEKASKSLLRALRRLEKREEL